VRADLIIERCRTLATLSETPDGLLRTFLSPPMHDVHRLLTGWMEAAGMQVRVDAAGNLRGVYPAIAEPARRLLVGSHVDTVPNAGAFDGPLGVMLAIALVESLRGRRALRRALHR
jgi:allantoate deiminase